MYLARVLVRSSPSKSVANPLVKPSFVQNKGYATFGRSSPASSRNPIDSKSFSLFPFSLRRNFLLTRAFPFLHEKHLSQWSRTRTSPFISTHSHSSLDRIVPIFAFRKFSSSKSKEKSSKTEGNDTQSQSRGNKSGLLGIGVALALALAVPGLFLLQTQGISPQRDSFDIIPDIVQSDPLSEVESEEYLEGYLEEAIAETEDNFWTQLLLPEMHLFLIAILAAIGSSVISLSIPRVVGELLDHISSPGAKSMIDQLWNSPALFCVGLLGAQALLQFMYSSLLSIASERISARLRSRIFAAILAKDIAFFDSVSTGELMSSISSEVQEVRSAVKHSVSMGIRSATQIVGGLVSLSFISGKLTGLMILLLPSMVLIGTIYGRFLQQLSKGVHKALAVSTAVAEEAVSNVRTVRAFSNEKKVGQHYNDTVEEYYQLAKRLGISIGIFQGMYNIWMNGAVVLVMLYGGKLVSNGELTSGALTSYMLYTMNLQNSMSTLSVLQGELVKGNGAAKRLSTLMRERPLIPLRGGERLPSVRGSVTFEDVSFSYPSRPHVPIFQNLNLQLDEGKVYALVGPSGSGKSTIAGLIERFYDPTYGKVKLDNVDITSLDPSWLRSQIGIVSQEPVLFATSILENIRFGKPNATEAEVRRAAKLANAEMFIGQFPDGYETLVGERGVQLSGGQKQRIAIARALLKNAKILILDEATSALDSESEQLVQEALQRLMVGRTVVLIAHRLSTVQSADQIIVLKNGQVLERGNHNELMKAKGAYARLVSKQIQ